MKTSTETQHIIDRLEAQHPDADTELHFTSAFELLVATILSAQSTDQGVNKVTPVLFRQYPNARALARATPAELEPQIHATGFFRAKSRALIGMANALVERHDGEVPADMEALTALPGVGRKTANVVLGHALGVPGFPVDRHVLRVANRLGIADGDDPEKVEAQLCSALPRARWTQASDTLILHGRRICKPSPRCDQCAAQEDCAFFHSADRQGPSRAAARSSSTGSAQRGQRKPADAPTPAARSGARRRAPRRATPARKRR